jgi:hypothetical protein
VRPAVPILAVTLAAALPASAPAKPVFGLVGDVASGPYQRAHATRRAVDPGNLPYGGGPVLHANRAHVIFWEPSGSGMSFDPGYMPLIETFLQNVAAASHRPDNVYGLTGQYTDGFGPATYDSTYGGFVLATDPLPPNGCVEPPVTGPGWTVCLTDKQLQTEIEHVVRTSHLLTTTDDVYFLVTPNGLGSCTDSTSSSCALGGGVSGYCGYHSQSADGEVLYAVIPYNAVAGHCQSGNPRPNASTADPTISTISHEHNETITDPVGDAWIDSSGSEDGDRCITVFGHPIGGSSDTAWNESIGGGHYFLQEEWSNDDHGCAAEDEPDQISFSWGWAVAGKPDRLTGHGRDPDGAIVAYQWFFGDGATGHGQVVRHVFRRRGSYKVTLRTTDRGGTWAYYTRTLRVASAAARRSAPTNAGGATAR